MLSQSMAGAFLAFVSLVAAQTHTVCDPTKKECDPNPALGGSVDIDYTSGKNDFFSTLDGTTLTYDKTKGAVFSIANEKQAPTIESSEFIFFGKVEVELMVAPGAGIVTSIVLQSLTLDEIDWEWLGGDANHVQTNYFSKGDTTTYDRGATHDISNAFTEFHTYTIDWTKEALTWSINGKVVRTLTYEAAKGGKEYPQTPMQVKLGSWVAGRSDAPQGTVEWAGGLANFDNGPSHAYYRHISVTDYAGGVKGAKQYIYSDKTGTWKSIEIDTENGGIVNKGGDNDDDDEDSTTSASATASATASSTKNSTTKATPTASQTDDDSEDSDANASGSADPPVQSDPSGSVSIQALTLAGVAISGFAIFANLL